MGQLQLEGAVDDRDDIITGQRQRIAQLQQELAEERQRNVGTDDGAKNLRKILTPLYRALQQVFGEMDGMGVDEGVVSASHGHPVDSRKSAVWESWKQKFPGTPAKFIDALLLHGALTQTQLRIHAQCAQGSVAGVVSTLWKAGLINKNNGKISLKEV